MDAFKRNFGFGFMRLPMQEKEVDIAETCRMVDAFLEAGFTYFDTAHGYLEGKSELALKECLTSRYPRDRYTLTNKLTNFYFKKEEDIRPLFESQLAACGVEYFDYYLMHAQNKNTFRHFKECHAYETAFALKAEGKVRHVGISFHDTAEFLKQILTEYPQIEVVQLQFNYLDYDDPAVQSRKCYEVCRKFGKPVIVMEPVKGGNLVKLPEDAKAVLNEQELAAVKKVQEIFRGKNLIPCTACRYCVDGCPMHIAIPDLFATMNTKQLYHDWNADYYYNEVHARPGHKASDCVKCGRCEKACPQHLPIRQLLMDVVEEFEKKEN